MRSYGLTRAPGISAPKPSFSPPFSPHLLFSSDSYSKPQEQFLDFKSSLNVLFVPMPSAVTHLQVNWVFILLFKVSVKNPCWCDHLPPEQKGAVQMWPIFFSNVDLLTKYFWYFTWTCTMDRSIGVNDWIQCSNSINTLFSIGRPNNFVFYFLLLLPSV